MLQSKVVNGVIDIKPKDTSTYADLVDDADIYIHLSNLFT